MSTLTIKLDDDTAAAVDEMARFWGCNRSFLLRHLLISAMDSADMPQAVYSAGSRHLRVLAVQGRALLEREEKKLKYPPPKELG